MSTKSKKKPQTGVRYSDEEKQKIVDFVIDYNAANGRGGQSAAMNKFKVTPLTIAKWIKNSGKKPAVKAAVKAAVKPAAKAAKPAKPAKPAKAAKPAGATKMGVRYTPEQKQEVVKFVQDYNAANGRGGQSQAATKFGLSVITVSSWLKAAGVKNGAAPKAVKVSKKAAKGAVVKAAKASAAPVGLAAKVASLVSISEQVSQAEKELEKLYTKHDAIMASIKSWV